MIITVFVGANLCVRPKNKITFKIKFYAKNIKNMDMMYTVTIPPLSLVTPDSSPKGRAFFLENGYKKQRLFKKKQKIKSKLPFSACGRGYFLFLKYIIEEIKKYLYFIFFIFMI